MKEILIKKEDSNQRIDKFVRKFLNEAPLSFIYKLFRKKDVKINKHRVTQQYILQEGDLLQIYVSDSQLEEFNKPKKIIDCGMDIDIIYEDENILIVNKPSGILIHGDEGEKRITLSNKVISYLYNKGEYNPKNQEFIPSPVHRLDRNTSGLVIFAKNVESSQLLMEELKTHENIKKTYLALVEGQTDKEGFIKAPLLKDSESGLVKVCPISKGGKEALTEYETIQSNGEYSLVKVNLVTGRTHQIRVHFSYINHPIIGDPKYGNFELNRFFFEKYKYKNQFLHAYSLKFIKMKGLLSYLSGNEFQAKLDNNKNNLLENIFDKF